MLDLSIRKNHFNTGNFQGSLLWQNKWQDSLVLLILFLLVYHTESFPEVRGCKKGQERTTDDPENYKKDVSS